jgi:hypothetical protein
LEVLGLLGKYDEVGRIGIAFLEAFSVEEEIEVANPADEKWSMDAQRFAPRADDAVGQAAETELSVGGAGDFETCIFEQLQDFGERVAFAFVAEFVGVDFARRDRNREDKFSVRAKNSRDVAEQP